MNDMDSMTDNELKIYNSNSRCSWINETESSDSVYKMINVASRVANEPSYSNRFYEKNSEIQNRVAELKEKMMDRKMTRVEYNSIREHLTVDTLLLKWFCDFS